MGGTEAHEFMVLNAYGEDTLVLCEACGYAANQQIAAVAQARPEPRTPCRSRRSRRRTRPRSRRSPRSSTSRESRTAKAAFFVAGDGRFIVAIVRGDYDVNETKLVNALKARRRAPAGAGRGDHGRAAWRPGYGSPIGARDAVVVVDDLVARSPNLVAGANRAGFHLRNVNVPRDFTPDVVTDIANVREGDPCPSCGAPVKLRNGIEVGNIFKLGTKFTDAAGRDATWARTASATRS